MEINKETVEIIQLDEETKADLLKKIRELINKNEPWWIKLVIRDLKGEPEDALEIIELIHKSENLDLEVEAFGKNGRAGTLLLAAGKPKSRHANSGSSFQILDGEIYEENVTLKDLRAEDETTVNALIILSGKKKYILEAITKSKYVSVSTAKRIGIADTTSEFINKYAIKSNRGRRNSEVDATEAVNESIDVK
jgi:hypothetical protein